MDIKPEIIKLNPNWRYSEFANLKKGNVLALNYDDTSFLNCTIPCDQKVIQKFLHPQTANNENGLLKPLSIVYRNKFSLKERKSGKYYFFSQGIGGVSSIYINQKLVCRNFHPYTPITRDITNFLVDGENIIVIFSSQKPYSSRYYEGVGLYRELGIIFQAFLIEPNSLRLTYNGTYKEKFNGKIKIEFNYLTTNLGLTTFTLSLSHPQESKFCFKFIKNITQSKQHLSFSISIKNALLWSVKHPNLYNLEIVSNFNNTSCLLDSTQIGLRKIYFTPTAFYLNNKKIKLKGVCLHNDNGLIGDEDLPDFTKHKLLLLKQMGTNAIRSVHNPASPSLLKLCDELGLLLIDEMFDTWQDGKRKFDYHIYFNKPSKNKHYQYQCQEDLAQMILRDRNHPSVIAYSLGNELYETYSPSSKIYKTLKLLKNTITKLDKTRPYLICQNGFTIIKQNKFLKLQRFMKRFPVIGINYSHEFDNYFLKVFKHKPVILTETSSAVKSRGFFTVLKQNNKVVDKTNNRYYKTGYLSDYGCHTVRWGQVASKAIKRASNPFFIGEFIWSGTDYLGEPTPWLNDPSAFKRSSYFGLITTNLLPKGDYFLYKSIWQESFNLKIINHLNITKQDKLLSLAQGAVIDNSCYLIRIYSNCYKVNLFLNNESLGEAKYNVDTLAFEKTISYKPGNLTARGYDKNDNIVCEDSVFTASNPVSLKFELLNDNSSSTLLIMVSVRDEKGVVHPLVNQKINFKLIGNAYIKGVDNGDPNSQVTLGYPETQKEITAEFYNGYLLLAIKRYDRNIVTLEADTEFVKTKLNI